MQIRENVPRELGPDGHRVLEKMALYTYSWWIESEIVSVPEKLNPLHFGADGRDYPDEDYYYYSCAGGFAGKPSGSVAGKKYAKGFVPAKAIEKEEIVYCIIRSQTVSNVLMLLLKVVYIWMCVVMYV